MIGEQTTHPGVKPITAVNSTALVVEQTGNVNIQAAGCNLTGTIVQCLGDTQAQGLITEQLAGAVVEAVRRDAKPTGTGNLATAVVDAIEIIQRQLATGIDQTCIVVVEVAVAQVQG